MACVCRYRKRFIANHKSCQQTYQRNIRNKHKFQAQRDTEITFHFLRANKIKLATKFSTNITTQCISNQLDYGLFAKVVSARRIFVIPLTFSLLIGFEKTSVHLKCVFSSFKMHGIQVEYDDFKNSI